VTGLDPRLNACRPDRADARLKGEVEAERFVEGISRRVVAFAAPLKRSPRSDAALDSEILRGELFRVFDETPEGWSWGQLETDSYVGYVPTDALGSLVPEPTHRVAVLGTFVYPGPDLKLPALGTLSLGCRLAISGGSETRGTVYAHLAGGEGAVVAAHLAQREAPMEQDFVAVAERFVETPYLWGGRTRSGLDCSALVQLSLAACGRPAPRDTDLQEKMLGEPVLGGITGKLDRGDLVFWRCHVGILVDGQRMLHASGHHMTVVIEKLADAIDRIARTAGAPTSVLRLSGDA
jgi:cell wall-associated NlpC family hydrolase